MDAQCIKDAKDVARMLFKKDDRVDVFYLRAFFKRQGAAEWTQTRIHPPQWLPIVSKLIKEYPLLEIWATGGSGELKGF